MSHNNDMIKLVKLFEGKQEFAEEEIGQKPGDQVRGTDKAETKGTDHPFKGRLVGEDTTLEDVLSKKYQDFKDIQAKKDSGASQEQETEFHKKLDTLVHKTFGKRKNESEQVDEISYPKGYLLAAERSLSQAQATQRQYWKSPEEKAAARRTELNREKGMRAYSKRHRAAHPEMYPKIEPRPAPKLRDPSTEYSDDYSVWAAGRRDTMEQGVEEASIPYALSAANAAAEYDRQGQAGGGYRGRIDIPVGSREDYIASGKALKKAAAAAGQHIEYGLSNGVMSVFSDSMTSDELDSFIDDTLENFDQGVAEGADNYSPVTNAITRRIMLQRHDLLSKYGVEKVSNAIDEVADFVGDVDEIGSSDVSGWVRHVEQLLSNMGESQINELGATHPAPPQGTATTGAITTTNAAPAAGSISPDEQTALNKINQNPAMKQQLDKLMTQATPGGSSAPMKLDPQEQDALDRVKANAGLGSQYAKLIAQANPAAAKTAAVKP